MKKYLFLISILFLTGLFCPIKSKADTFGYETQGGTTMGFCNSGFGNPEATRRGGVFSPASSGTLNNIKFYGQNGYEQTNTVDTTVFVNTKNSGGAGTHGQVATKENTLQTYNSTVTLYTHTLSSGSISSGTDYILNVIGDGTDMPSGGNYVGIMSDASGSGYYESFYGTGSYATGKESPWTTTNTDSNKYSIYATYTPSGGGETNQGGSDRLIITPDF